VSWSYMEAISLLVPSVVPSSVLESLGGGFEGLSYDVGVGETAEGVGL